MLTISVIYVLLHISGIYGKIISTIYHWGAKFIIMKSSETRIGEKIRKVRQMEKLTLQELAQRAGISTSYLGDIEKKRSNPSVETLLKISRALEKPPGFFLNDQKAEHPKPANHIPILGTIRTGIPILSAENYEGELKIPSDIRADFALETRGNSMIGAGIQEGDYAICRKAETAENGDIVVALMDITPDVSEATLKYFFNTNGARVLRAANPDYEDIPLQNGHRIGGKMVTLLRKNPTSYNYYQEYLSIQNYNLKHWNQVIEKAVTSGISPSIVEQFIETQMEIAKKLAAAKNR